MPSIVPPLDIIPKLPGKGADIVSDAILKQTDLLLDQVTELVQNTIKLPENAGCADPNVVAAKEQLQRIQTQLDSLQSSMPKIQQTISIVQQIVSVAQSIKATTTLAQLSNPVTAGVFIATQLIAIQDATIVNSIASLKQLSVIADSLTSKLNVIVPQLTSAVSKIASACNTEEFSLEVPEFNSSGSLDAINYANELPTKFYIEDNVSDSDIAGRSAAIEYVLATQQDLLTSIQEAPSQVYREHGVPAGDLGKIGDYYIDLDTFNAYGPKLSKTDWGQPVN